MRGPEGRSPKRQPSPEGLRINPGWSERRRRGTKPGPRSHLLSLGEPVTFSIFSGFLHTYPDVFLFFNPPTKPSS
jgi:hypothetical protein